MEPPGGQPTIQGRVHECGKILWVEHLAGNWNNGLPGNECVRSQRRLGVVANQVKYLLPLWIGDRELLGWRNENGGVYKYGPLLTATATATATATGRRTLTVLAAGQDG